MNWEKSKAITPLKRDFLQSFFAKEKRFFLTGGSALGLFYLEHRYSFDLDLFTSEKPDWLEIDGLFHVCRDEIGASSETVRDSPTFRRYRLYRESESEIVDFVLAIDRQIDETKVLFDNVKVDTLHEIFVNKITTLISRCEIKDLVDLYFLEQEGMRIEEHFNEARQKDGGLDPAMISSILKTIHVTELPDYLIKPLSIDAFRSFVETLRKRMALLAYPDA